MAGQSITFDFLSRGAATLSRDFRSIGDDSALSSRGVKVLGDVIEKLGAKEDRTAAESKILAGALRQTGDAADRATAKAVLADAAIRRLGDAMQDSQKKSDGLGKALGGLKLNPGLLGPVLALVPALASLSGVAVGAAAGLGGAFIAGGAALAAFGAVAKPIMTDAKKAADAVGKAQSNYNIAIANGVKPAVAFKAEQVAIAKAYAGMSPAQIALSKQLGDMASAWDKVKAAETPVVAGALQPWLQSVTDLTGKLAPIIAKIAPVIHDLGTKFDGLVNSAAFRAFRDFIGSTGSAMVSAGGSTIIDLVKSFMILLPKFDPLIREAVGWIARLGPAVLAWSSSKKASDDITRFMQWFSTNGPVVGDLLKNIGAALKAMAPGLTAGGMAELQVMSQFFALVAKLPPGLAKPLFEVAGAMLILQKVGVVSVGIKLTGLALGASGVSAPLALAGAGIGAGFILAVKNAIVSGWKGVLGILPSLLGGIGGILNLSATGWTSTILAKFDKPIRAAWASLGHFLASSFDVTRGQVAAIAANLWHQVVGSFDQTRTQVTGIWNTLWNNTVTRASNGVKDVERWFANLRAGAATAWAGISSTVTGLWNTLWANTVTRAANGVRSVETWFANLRAGAATAWAGISSQAVTAWNTIWNNTVTRAANGVAAVMTWVGSLPGKVRAAFTGAGGWLLQAGKDVIQGFWNGLTSIWGSVMKWISGIASWIKAHKGPVSLDKTLLYPAGHAMMSGLLSGLKAGFGPVGSFVGGLASFVSGKITAAGGKLAGGIVSFISSLINAPGSGVSRWIPLIQQALKMEGLDAGLLRNVLIQMQSESGGNPNAINLCLTLDHEILTRRGWLDCDEVRPGDETPAWDMAAGRSGWTTVTAVHRYDGSPVWRLSSAGWSATATAQHRWLLADGGYVTTADITPDTKIRLGDDWIITGIQCDYQGRAPTWCVTTELGTWTTRGGDARPFLTGNSDINAQHGDPSRGLLAHADHRVDIRRVPLARHIEQHLRPAR